MRHWWLSQVMSTLTTDLESERVSGVRFVVMDSTMTGTVAFQLCFAHWLLWSIIANHL